MHISELFNLFKPNIIAQQLCMRLLDFTNIEKFHQMADEISQCPKTSPEFVLTKLENDIMLLDVPESSDVFKTMSLETLANLETGETYLSMKDATILLEDYAFFRE